MQSEKENRPATAYEKAAHLEITNIAKSWLLTSDITQHPDINGKYYGVQLFDQAKALNNTWFAVEGVPKFLWGMWTVPLVEIEGRKMGWEWYLRVQDVFFKSMLEGYYKEFHEQFVILRGTAYPNNTLVPTEDN